MGTYTLFCLASGRSGTHFLYELLRRNVRGAVCRHEPYVWNPSMFGRPIYDRATGDEAAIRKLAQRKRRIIEGHRSASAYIETSHAFLKSWSDLAIEHFPGMKLIHLIRHPLAVAKSEAAREAVIHRWRLPLRNYRGGDGKSYFRWSLTGLEPIFGQVGDRSLSRLQWYVLQWIEIENRAMAFLNRYGKAGDCCTLLSPAALNDAAQVRELLEFLALSRQSDRICLEGRRNRTPGVRLEITEQDRQELAEILRLTPTSYLEIFRRPPYTEFPWASELQSGLPGAGAPAGGSSLLMDATSGNNQKQ
jgi:hypothetical protein